MGEPKTFSWTEYRERYATAPVLIAGQRFDLLYRLQEKDEIEQKLGKALHGALFQSGQTRDWATVLWFGIKHQPQAKKLGSVDAVVRLLQQHNESSEDASVTPIYRAVVRSVIASKLLGGPNEINLAQVEAHIGADEEEEGKAQGAA